MNIMPISSFVYQKQKPSFKSYNTNIYKNNKLAYRTQTELFRRDFPWDRLTNTIIEKYRNVDKVNIVNHACSAGYESYSLLIQLIDLLEDNYKKFMPIIARDIDKKAIEYAKRGQLEINDNECQEALYRYTFSERFDIECLEYPSGIYEDNKYVATCPKDLKENIDFGCSNIFDDKELINKDNTVLICRNFWPYLGDKASELAQFLAKNMKPSSLLIIGGYDYNNGIKPLLETYGFRNKCTVGLVFDAPGNL